MTLFNILRNIYAKIDHLRNIVKYYLLKFNNKKKYSAIGPYKIDGLKKYLRDYKDNCRSMKIKYDINRVKSYVTFCNNLDKNFITEEFYKYNIEPYLNLRRYSSTIFFNKGFIDFLPNIFHSIPDIFIHNYLKKINGIYYDKYFNTIKNPEEFIRDLTPTKILFKKVLDTGRSLGVIFFFKNEDGDYESISGESFINRYLYSSDNYILQEIIQQHKFLDDLNSSSINTVRLITYRSVKDEKIHLLHYYLRVGVEGELTDTVGNYGRIKIFNDGTLDNKKILKDYTIENINSKMTFPFFDKTKSIAKQIAKYFPYHRMISFDFTIDKSSKIILVELNSAIAPEPINFLSGSLFGKFTEEVMKYVNSRKYYVENNKYK